MYEVWITDGHYIQGKKVGNADTPAQGAKKAAARLKKDFGFEGKLVREKDVAFTRQKKSYDIWLDDVNDGRPLGILVKITD